MIILSCWKQFFNVIYTVAPKSLNGNTITSTNIINVDLTFVEDTDRIWVDTNIRRVSQQLRRPTRKQFI